VIFEIALAISGQTHLGLVVAFPMVGVDAGGYSGAFCSCRAEPSRCRDYKGASENVLRSQMGMQYRMIILFLSTDAGGTYDAILR
jgi:hypothetical protein